jgi:MSHA biogenesis protein MshJ
MKLLTRWLELCERFDMLVVRERMLLFGCCLAGLYLVFDTLFIMPSTKEAARLTEEIVAVQKKVDQIATEKKVFDQVSQRDPDADIKREQLKLQGRLLQLEGGLEDLSLRLVSSERLPEILQSVSQKAEKVQLKSLQTLRPEAIDLAGNNVRIKSIAQSTKDYVRGEETGAPAPTEKVYRHAIQIQLEGGYFEVIDFLHELESLEWRFYWESLDYRVVDFPRALIDIQLYTLSTSEGMLGE